MTLSLWQEHGVGEMGGKIRLYHKFQVLYLLGNSYSPLTQGSRNERQAGANTGAHQSFETAGAVCFAPLKRTSCRVGALGSLA